MKWLSFRLAYLPGKDFLDKRKWDEAETRLKKALEIIPFHPDATMALAQVLWGAGKREEAYQILQRFLEKEPSFAPCYFLQGIFHAEEKDFEKASSVFERSLELDPKNIEAWYELGKVYVKLEMDAKAFLAFHKATQSDPFLVPFRLSVLKEKLALKRKA